MFIGFVLVVEFYLNVEFIIVVVKSSGVDVIYFGYGFLLENSVFVKLCLDN